MPWITAVIAGERDHGGRAERLPTVLRGGPLGGPESLEIVVVGSAISAGARYNEGARQAQGALVLFLQPGRPVDPELVARHLKCWRDGGRSLGAVIGADADQGWPDGADFSVARAMLECVGGFDERPM